MEECVIKLFVSELRIVASFCGQVNELSVSVNGDSFVDYLI
jgi:hypothetical protein